MQLFLGTLFVGGFLAAPTLLVWGWVRWISHPGRRDQSAALSFAGFLLATASALLAIAAIVYSFFIGGFPHYDRRLLAVDVCGVGLSLLGVMLSGLGTARVNLIRWQSVGCSVGTLLFWIASISSE